MTSLLFFLLLLAIASILWVEDSRISKIWLTSLFYGFLSLVTTSILWSIQSWSIPLLSQVSKPGGFLLPTFLNNWGLFGLSWDSLSLSMVLLTALLTPSCLIISMGRLKIMVKEFCLLLFFTHLILVLVFSVDDLILFYILFESTLIPLFIMIGVWGGREEKVKAAFYFFIFTLVGSVFMLLAVLKTYSLSGSTSLIMIFSIGIPSFWQWWIALGLVVGMAVKIPMFPAHIWLPQAHVEAPVAGSVLLAGIMLKLGGYGLIKFCWPIVPEGITFISPVFITLSIVAIIYGGLITCRQSDMKRLVAYSSVAHMGLVTAAIFSGDPIAQLGSIFIMLSHGIVSSALFISVTQLYDRTGTRLIRYYRGVVITMPLFSALFVVLNLANMALPLSANFLAELISIVGIMRELPLVAPLMAVGVVLSAAYSLFMVNRISFGVPSPYTLKIRDLGRKEVYPVTLLAVLTYQLGVCPNWVVSPLQSYSLL
uniref:NADH-ubiquinone oxidoreductase chain 4 n=1 Tax=Carybdea alata TaxID=1193083 RepID=G9IBZ8_CARAL|nr:NADH dehydrogenase subunit 4 [Alatina alata]